MSQGQGRKTVTYGWTSDAKISQKATISAMCGHPLLLGYSVAERNSYGPHSSPSNPLSISWKQSWGQGLSVCDCWILAFILSFRIFLLKVWFPVSLHRSNWNKRLNAESQSLAQKLLKFQTYSFSSRCDLKYGNIKRNHSYQCSWYPPSIAMISMVCQIIRGFPDSTHQ